jgi:hypothetical protein
MLVLVAERVIDSSLMYSIHLTSFEGYRGHRVPSSHEP